MEEYDYLEQQLEGGVPAPTQEQLPPPPPAPSGRESKDSKRSRSRDHSDRKSTRDKSSRRSSRSRSRDRRRRSRSRSRERDRKPDYHGGQHRPYNRGDPSTRPYSSKDRREQHQNNFRPHNQGYQHNVMAPPKEQEPPEVRLQREKEQEQKDLERTVRTVMAMNLNLRATEKDIFDFFGCVGQINDIRLICDKNTKRSKGISYIEFGTVQSAINAVTLNGQVMMGMPVLVKPSEAEKNLAWEAQEQAKKNQAATMQMMTKMGQPGMRMNPIKLQVLNLHPDIGDEDLKELFAPFGEVNYTHVVRDAQGASTGEAYAQYADLSMAENAIKHFNGFELAGKKMSVQIAPLYSTTLPGGLPMPPPFPGGMPGMAPPGMMPGMLPPPPGLPGPDANAGAGEVDDLDEAENKSFKLNAQSRQALMSRLASSAGLQAPPSFLGTSGAGGGASAASSLVSQQVLMDQGLLGPASPIPTPCILLRNMFSEADKAESGWEADVADDVRSEASKFGEVLHCHVDPASKGHVYLKFAHQQAAEAATRAFNGRYYSGNQIVVSYQFLQPYNAFFGQR